MSLNATKKILKQQKKKKKKNTYFYTGKFLKKNEAQGFSHTKEHGELVNIQAELNMCVSVNPELGGSTCHNEFFVGAK